MTLASCQDWVAGPGSNLAAAAWNLEGGVEEEGMRSSHSR